MNIEIAPKSTTALTYDEAVMYCFFLDYNGHTDWRLPTKDEYVSFFSMSGCWDSSDGSLPDMLGGITHRVTIPVRTVNDL